MTARLLGVVSALALVSLAPTAHARSTQEDIQMCRDAMAAQGKLNMDEYRLSFESKRGNSTRTLSLEAIPNAGGEKFEVTCTISKSAVTEVTVTEA